jgi:hypothetical protein
MATTTPNFGWPVPTSTDLVKDGATAIESLGDSIDASLVDLKGGTTGQVLKKNSGTDMDFVWSADSAGMTNPMTTTGDTIYSSSGSTPARLGIGTAGQFLKVNSGATAPEWATLSAGGMTQLASGSLTGSATIRLQSIPSTYKFCRLYIRNHIATTTNLSLRFRLNNDSTANRYASGGELGQNYSETFRYDSVYCTSDLSNTTAQGMAVFEIHDYSNTTSWKMFSAMAIGNNKTTSTSIQLGNVVGAYNQTGAVTEIDIFSDQGNWTGGTYNLYGVN